MKTSKIENRSCLEISLFMNTSGGSVLPIIVFTTSVATAPRGDTSITWRQDHGHAGPWSYTKTPSDEKRLSPCIFRPPWRCGVALSGGLVTLTRFFVVFILPPNYPSSAAFIGQDDVLAGWIIGASSAVISMHWVTLPARWNRPARDDSSTSSLHRSGALALMMGESGDGDNGSDMGRPSLNGESECDARNIA